MRNFTVDNPEFFCFKIGEDTDTVYKIPLMASMSNREAKAFEATNGEYMAQVEWMRGYIGDVVDDLSIASTQQIIRAWVEESQEQGATVGES